MRASYITPDDLAEKLEGVRRSGSGFTARCPIHEDRIQSLKVSPGHKATLIYCHAGCRTEEILAIFGWSIAETFHDYREEGNRRDEWSMDLVMRQMVAKRNPINLWEPYTLADVMRGTFHPTDADTGAERMASVGVEWGDYLQLPFDPEYEQHYVEQGSDGRPREFTVVGAFRLWHVTANGPVLSYLRPWLERTNGDWSEIKPRAMQAMWTYWRRERGEGALYR